MSADRILQLKLIGDVQSLNKDMKATEGRLNRLGRSAASWGKAFAQNLVISGIAKLGDLASDAVEGFRADVDAATRLATTFRNLDIDADRLAGTLQTVGDRAVSLGFDDAEAQNGLNTFLKQTGKLTHAQELLGFAMDIARSENISLSEAIRRAQSVYVGSSRALDRYGLSGVEGMRAVRLARRRERGQAKEWAKNHPMDVLMGRLGEVAEVVAGALIPLADGAARFVDSEIVPHLERFVEALTTGDWEGKMDSLIAGFAALAAIGILVTIAHPLFALAAALAAVTVAGVWLASGGAEQIGAGLQGIRDKMEQGEPVSDLERAMVALQDAGMGLQEFLTGVLGPVIRPFFDGIAAAWSIGQAIVTLDLDAFFAGLQRITQSGINLILAPFQAGWEAIKSGFKALGIDIPRLIRGAIDGAVRAVRDLLRAILNMWNSLDLRIPPGSFQFWGASDHEFLGQKISIPRFGIDWAGSKDFIPDVSVPGLASGGIVTRPTLAMIGEGGPEAVVPLGHGMGNTYIINLGLTTDPASAGRAVVEAIKAHERRAGSGWRS